jgi:2-polyprenyl-3-methyl-5-hydroxy-6-metoxy-1,4-benzoquinol methylase
MKIKDLLKHFQKSDIYEPGNAIMWTDPHISKQLLHVHLNEHVDLGSRKPETIRKTVDWILSHTKKEKLNILDLGCGPGLYSEILAQKGHQVTGVDFSKNSIEYAVKEAQKKNLDISYLNEDYTELDLPENKFDLVLLIFTDFGPLLPEDRELLLKKVKSVLKPGGLFIFDVLNDTNIKNKLSPKNWEASEQGFWSEKPYLLLSESFLYEEEKVILYQNIVIEDNNTKVYRFWNHFFSNSDLIDILENFDFEEISFHNNIIPGGDGYESGDITFCVAVYAAKH